MILQTSLHKVIDVTDNEQYRDPKRFAHNENHFGLSPSAIHSIRSMTHFLTEYPRPQPTELLNALAEKFNMNTNQFAVGNGSSDLIQIIYYEWILKTNNPEVVCTDPAFAYYPYLSEIHDVHHLKVTPRNATMFIHPEDIVNAVTQNTSVVFITNPNNPTGCLLKNSEIEYMLQRIPNNILIVIDEAYVEYVMGTDYDSATKYINDHHNVIVLRTFSKAYGLAALRVGYAISNPNNILRINKHIPPFRINSLAEAGALAALCDKDTLEKTRLTTHEQRNWLFNQFHQLSIHVIPSQTNFLLIKLGYQTKKLYDNLTENGFKVRYEASINAIRITIGTHEENIQLIHTIKIAIASIPVGTLSLHTGIQSLFEIAQMLSCDDTSEATRLLDKLLHQHTATSHDVTERVIYIFAKKLSTRLQQTEAHNGNLYTKEEQLQAFHVLMQNTPFISFGHTFANHAIARTFHESTCNNIHIIDLGIGSGKQWHDSIRILTAAGARNITITGIDIPSNTEIDTTIRQPMLSIARNHGCNNFTYHHIPKTFEDLCKEDFATDKSAHLVVNAAFAIHHLKDKQGFIQLLSTCPINLLTLIEPDTEHDNILFPARLRTALSHYGSTLHAIDNMIENTAIRQIIEQGFFGREIENVLHHDDLERYERHQENLHWHWLMSTNGFSPLPVPNIADEISKQMKTPQGITYQTSANTTKIMWNDIPIIAATLWTH